MKICTTVLLNPHFGCSLLPFMKRTILFSPRNLSTAPFISGPKPANSGAASARTARTGALATTRFVERIAAREGAIRTEAESVDAAAMVVRLRCVALKWRAG